MNEYVQNIYTFLHIYLEKSYFFDQNVKDCADLFLPPQITSEKNIVWVLVRDIDIV